MMRAGFLFGLLLSVCAPVPCPAEGRAMPQPWGSLDEGQCHIVIGLPGDGKTTLAERLTDRAYRTVYFSPDFEDYCAPGRLDVFTDELGAWPQLLRDPHLRITVRPRSQKPRDLAEDIETLRVLTFRAGNLVLVMDELGSYSENAENDLNIIAARARKKGVVPIFVTQVAVSIPKTVRRIASHVHSLGQNHVDDLDALRKNYGEEFSERVRHWRRFEPPIEWVKPQLRQA